MSGISLVFFYWKLCVLSLEEIYEETIDKYNWCRVRRDVIRKFQCLRFLNTEERIMDFIQAGEKTKSGQKVRRKSWKKAAGMELWWDEKYECMLAGTPDRHQKEDEKYKDTDGWIYVCRGNDIEATDWEEIC